MSTWYKSTNNHVSSTILCIQKIGLNIMYTKTTKKFKNLNNKQYILACTNKLITQKYNKKKQKKNA